MIMAVDGKISYDGNDALLNVGPRFLIQKFY